MRPPFRPQACRRHDLGPSQRLLVSLPAGTRCRVVYGNAWITQTDDLADHFLRHGESLTLARHGSVLIEASRPAPYNPKSMRAFEHDVLKPLLALNIQPLDRSKSAIGGDCR